MGSLTLICTNGTLSSYPSFFARCVQPTPPTGATSGTCSGPLSGNGSSCALRVGTGYTLVTGSLTLNCTNGSLSSYPVLAQNCAKPIPPAGSTAGSCTSALAGTRGSCSLAFSSGYTLASGTLTLTCSNGTLSPYPSFYASCAQPTPPPGATAGTCIGNVTGNSSSCTLGAASGYNLTTGSLTLTCINGMLSSYPTFTLCPSAYIVKLVGSGAAGSAQQVENVALSADGHTMAVGGRFDSAQVGAVWIFIFTSGMWIQQGNKLVGSGSIGSSSQSAVALSADGNTLVVGGYGDNNKVGAVWVWTRSNGVWTQQGGKMIGTGAVGAAQQGYTVSISADGNTFATGGHGDNSSQGSSQGAVWVWTRNISMWTQQGSKLVGSGAAGGAVQGDSLSLSADGNTVAFGAPYDRGILEAQVEFKAAPFH
jgi:hypothetical protein